MKEVKHYVCEICKTEYNDKKKCQECEDGHNLPIKITGYIHKAIKVVGSGYPTKVTIEMSDGEEIEYKR